MNVQLQAIVRYADRLMRHRDTPDWPEARNGLQLENNGTVTRIAAAVDAHELTIAGAVNAGADLLLVHHGMLWGSAQPVTGALYRRLRTAITGNLAVYSSHLPLDLHPRLGNNARLARALGLRRPQPFFEEHGVKIGFQARVELSRDQLLRNVRAVTGAPAALIPGGPGQVRRVGVVSGGAGNSLSKAAAEGVDTFITGEGDHWTFGAAHELGLNLIYAGHYATETPGIKALAAHLARRFRLPWVFIDVPSGL
jgi:dinuclear metal center YbgI/SA1388 family protein